MKRNKYILKKKIKIDKGSSTTSPSIFTMAFILIL